MYMMTYWDLEPKTRAALSESDVQRYVDAELMLKGVLKVEPPQLDPEPDAPRLEKVTHYKLSGFDAVFETMDQAVAFAELAPKRCGRRYIGNDYGNAVDYCEPKTPESLGVVPVQLARQVDVDSVKAELERVGAIRSANAKKSQEYATAFVTQNKALEGLWRDWHDLRAEATRHRKVVDTFAAYVQTAGDHDVAAKFLLKVFSEEQIKAASEWTGVTIATRFIEAPEPGPSHPDAPEPSATADDIAF